MCREIPACEIREGQVAEEEMIKSFQYIEKLLNTLLVGRSRQIRRSPAVRKGFDCIENIEHRDGGGSPAQPKPAAWSSEALDQPGSTEVGDQLLHETQPKAEVGRENEGRDKLIRRSGETSHQGDCNIRPATRQSVG